MNEANQPVEGKIYSGQDNQPAKPKKGCKTAKNEPKSQNPLSLIHTKAIEAWHNWYLSRTGIKPIISGKEAKAMQLIVKNLCSIAEQEKVFEIFETILTYWNKLPLWYQSNISLSIINSRLNEILNCIKNGHSENRRAGSAAPINGAAINSSLDNFYRNRQHGGA